MKIVLWTKYHCQYCSMAKSVLQRNNLIFEERKIGDGWTKEDLLECVPDAKSLPQIICDDKIIGGYTSLLKFLEETLELTRSKENNVNQ